ncbi:MAG TPA: thiamine pyrophosphate-binding protein [Candidatus Limiplasma sp.]|nr:thiamine pyrophosphate-binding protein [Candidatus Limiplasma sp.]
MIKVSDYISQFLVDQGIRHLFLIPGGGMMHMLDSVASQKDLDLVFNLNEQASGICAESYGQFTNHLGACLLTTGPGATNAVTGCAGAWLDSTPALYISGQCKTEQMGQLKGLRIYGAQEVAIIPMVKPITKYAVTVLDPAEIRYHMEKAVYLATHGRRGPAWIDVPLDVQGAHVELETLKGFDPAAEGYIENSAVSTDDLKSLYDLINRAERPVILIGHGVVASGQQQAIRSMAEAFQIPVLATWRAKGVFGDEESLYMGCPGVPAPRYANYVLQNADFVLILGTRLNPAITAFDEPHFAYQAKKVMVDIERAEIDKLSIPFAMTFAADLGDFIPAMLSQKKFYQAKPREPWKAYCAAIKAKYPLDREAQPYDNEGKTDGYRFAKALSDRSKVSDVFVGSSSGRSCGISHMAYELKQGQSFVTSMGLGSMGWCVPSAISCCFASGKRRTLVLEGDGSLQSNIQELALISQYHLPLKLFIFSNHGYASVYTMQRNNFNNNFAGCDPQSGLGFAPPKEVAATYGLPYYLIESDEQIDAVLDEIMKDNRPCLCEIIGSLKFDEIPKSMTIANKDGTFSSSLLENLYPFLPEQEQLDNMPNWEGRQQ